MNDQKSQTSADLGVTKSSQQEVNLQIWNPTFNEDQLHL